MLQPNTFTYCVFNFFSTCYLCNIAEWAASSPLLIALFGLLAGATVTELLYTTVLALITTGGLFAAAISTGFNATWPIFALGTLCVLV